MTQRWHWVINCDINKNKAKFIKFVRNCNSSAESPLRASSWMLPTYSASTRNLEEWLWFPVHD
jgi:hypothetical protein